MTASIDAKVAREIFVWIGKYELSKGFFIDIIFDSASNTFDKKMQYYISYKDNSGNRKELSVSGENIIEPKVSHSLGKSY